MRFIKKGPSKLQIIFCFLKWVLGTSDEKQTPSVVWQIIPSERRCHNQPVIFKYNFTILGIILVKINSPFPVYGSINDIIMKRIILKPLYEEFSSLISKYFYPAPSFQRDKHTHAHTCTHTTICEIVISKYLKFIVYESNRECSSGSAPTDQIPKNTFALFSWPKVSSNCTNKKGENSMVSDWGEI